MASFQVKFMFLSLHYTIFISYSVVLQHMLPSVQRTLKTRYKLTDTDVRGLNAAQGVSLMVALVFVGYFGNFRSRKIPCIAAGMALSGKLVIQPIV